MYLKGNGATGIESLVTQGTNLVLYLANEVSLHYGNRFWFAEATGGQQAGVSQRFLRKTSKNSPSWCSEVSVILRHSAFFVAGQDSNLRPQDYETCKLPTAPLRDEKQGYWRKDTVNALTH